MFYSLVFDFCLINMYCTWNGEKYTGHNGKEILVLRNTKKNLVTWTGSQGRREALHQENMSPEDRGVLGGRASSWKVAEKERTLSGQTAYAKYKPNTNSWSLQREFLGAENFPSREDSKVGGTWQSNWKGTGKAEPGKAVSPKSWEGAHEDCELISVQI